MKDLLDLPRLGELEKQVLEFLWQVNEADVQKAYKVLGVPRGITLNTVGSALERLYKKKLVTRERQSHAYLYRPLIDRETFLTRSMVEAAGGLKALGDKGLVSAFIDLATEANDETLDELAELIQRKREQKR